MRARFFGAEASTAQMTGRLRESCGDSFRSLELDVRDRDGVERVLLSTRARSSW